MPLVADPKALVWYLAITEWIVLSAPPIHIEIQESIRRGDVACQLGRPVSYIGAAFCEGLGTIAVRAPVLFVTACGCAFAFTGWLPRVTVLAAVVPLGVCATALITALSLGLGLLAFWLGDINPLWWVFQKSLFVFGGMMMPLRLYPDVVRRVAPFTPFPATLAGPASLVLDASVAKAIHLVVTLGAWSAITAVGLSVLYRRATLTLTFNGG